MAVSRVKTSSILQGFPKSRSLLAGNTAYNPSNFESIQTVTVGSGGSASVEFTSIPSTYKHLQIRVIGRFSTATQANDTSITINGATSGYSAHSLYGNGSSALALDSSGGSGIKMPRIAGSSATANVFGAWVADILDYANTNKYKTIRALGGVDGNTANTAYQITLASGAYLNTTAVSSIQIYPDSGLFSQYSSFALYGVK